MSSKTLAQSLADVAPSALFALPSRVALVTGGGTGVGLMLSTALAGAGARVYIVGRRGDVLEESARRYSPKQNGQGEGEIVALGQYDVRRKADCERMARDLEGSEERLDVLVNNSGIQPQMSGYKAGGELDKVKEKLLQWDEEEWKDIWATNVMGCYFTTAALLPLLGKSRDVVKGMTPLVVNIGSKDAFQKTATQNMAYSTSKAAVVHLTKQMATEFQNLGIRANCICPGQFPAEMTAGGRNSTDESNVSELEWPEEKVDHVPAGRPGSHKDMAGTILYLASRAGVYMNGQALVVDGGVLIVEPSSL